MSRRVVVVGNGMAGARLVDELRRRDPRGVHVRPVVLGEEPHAAYNRVLLSTVLAGGLGAEAVRLQPEGWAAAHGVDVRTGTTVVGIDRGHQQVECSDGTRVDYDVLVLATGSRAWLPPVEGLSDAEGLPAPGVVCFRTVTDCQVILAAARPGQRVVVLGGGLLGLEAARGVLGRGAEVTVVHPGAVPMDRQLDAGAGAVLTRVLTGLGVRVRLSARAVAYRCEPGARGLVLDDGSFVGADLVVVAAGVRPQVELARAAGLACEQAVLVDDELRTSDRRIRAIGECAQHRGAVHGLVQPAWEHAAVVADLLTGSDPEARYGGSRVVTRLKAHDVDLAAMGDVSATGADPADEVVIFSDPTRGRYGKLVLRDERVVGAVLLGSPEAAAAVTQLFDRGAPAPVDRLSLLLGRPVAAEAAPSPVHMPGAAVVCRCNTVTKTQVTTAWRAGARSAGAQATATRAGTGCGSCRDLVEGICSWLAESEPDRTDRTIAAREEGAA